MILWSKSVKSLIVLILMVLTTGFTAGFAKGFYNLTNQQDKWWLVNPEGKPFYSLGINNIQPEDSSAKKGAKRYSAYERGESLLGWSKTTLNMVKQMGYNTVGSWSTEYLRHKGFAHVELIGDNWFEGKKLYDIFTTGFDSKLKDIVDNLCAPNKNDPDLLGYFIGNDLAWYGDFPWYNGHESYLFDIYFNLPSKAPGKVRTMKFLNDYFRTVDNVNKVWPLKVESIEDITNITIDLNRVSEINKLRLAFVDMLSGTYYKKVTEAIRKSDPNHLVFSDRLANSVPEPVLRNAGKYCDAIAVNYYRKKEGLDIPFLSALYAIARKPVLIAEFTFNADDNTSGLGNMNGPFMHVKDQKARADSYKAYTLSFSGLPFIIGSHWFQFFDDPQGGRYFDLQECNYGIIDIYGKPYKQLMQAMKEMNPRCLDIHMKAPIHFNTNQAVLTDKISVRNGVKSQTFNGKYYCPETGKAQIKQAWGDFEKGSAITYSDTDGGLEIKYDTGAGWGCGLAIFSENYEQFGYLDAAGYKGIKVILKLPEGLRFQLHINESGADKPSAGNFPGKNGADGESYISPVFLGGDRAVEYTVLFKDFTSRSVWGNQNGNKTIDLQGLYNIELYIEGKQGNGIVLIKDINFY